MALQQELDKTRETFERSTGEHTARILADYTRALKESEIEIQAIKQGERMPDFELPSATGEQVRLSEVLKNGPAVVFFYRGKW
jgi:hypothetical protein